jgi:hypothetical protein
MLPIQRLTPSAGALGALLVDQRLVAGTAQLVPAHAGDPGPGQATSRIDGDTSKPAAAMTFGTTGAAKTGDARISDVGLQDTNSGLRAQGAMLPHALLRAFPMSLTPAM